MMATTLAVHRLAFAVTIVCLFACNGSPNERERILISDSADTKILSVPQPGTGVPLTILAGGQWGKNAPIRRVADARAISAGQTGVLDDVTGELWIVEMQSNDAFSVGGIDRPFPPARRPTAFTVIGDTIAIWDRTLRVFTMFNRAGLFLGTLPIAVLGDAASLDHREASELQDLRLRLRATPTTLWLEIEDDEHEMLNPEVRGFQEVKRRGYITTLHHESMAVDTLLTYEAATRYVELGPPSHTGAMFLPQVRWTVNADVFAYGRSDTAEVRIYDLRSKLQAIIRWPPVRKRLDNEEKRAHVRAYVREFPELVPPDALDPKNSAMLNEAADAVHMAEFAPEFSAIEVAGSCIWIAPFDFEANADGSSRRWSYYNLGNGREGTVLFDTTAVKITYIGQDFAVGRHIDANTAVHSIRWYALPGAVAGDCSPN